MKRKILSLILVFAMTVSLLTVGTGAVEPTYGDTAGHWAESSIERWSAYGIIQGSNGLFDPNGQLTCAQLATILAKLLKLPAAKDAGFTDNTADAWYYDAINRCAAAGILNGNGDGTVTPEAPITRERAMVMLARALGIEPIRKPDLAKYTDAAQVSAYAQGYVAALIKAGIVGGVGDNRLAPQDNITRASTVTILDRAIGVYADKDGMTVNAKDGELVLVVAKNVKVINAPEGTKIVVADGATGLTVNGKAVSDDQTYIVPKTTSSGSSSGGYSHSHNWVDNYCAGCNQFRDTVVAAIGTKGYETLAAAVAAAHDGDTVKLVGNTTLTSSVEINKSITLDLNGKTIETNGKEISVAGTGDLTVTGNGIVNNQVDADTTNRYTMLSVEEGGKLTIENGTFTTKAAQIVCTYGSTTIRGGTFKNTSKETDDAFNSKALIVVCGIPASLTMTDGTVTTGSQYLYGVFVRDGGNAIFGDEETKNGPSIHTHRYAAIGENNTMATANITIYGGEYTVSTVPVSDEWKPFCATIYASASGKINIHGGTFTGYYAISDRYEKVEQTVTITGGTFNGAAADLHVTSAGGKGTTANRIIAIAGGTFNHKPDATYIATGYEAKDNENNTWTVSEKAGVTLVAQVGGVKYTTLAAAITAAQNGDTVKLLANETVDSTISVNKNLKLDLGGKALTGTSCRALHITGGKLELTGTGTVKSTGIAVNSSVVRVGDDSGEARSVELVIGKDVVIDSPDSYGVGAFGTATTEKLTIYGTIKSTAMTNESYDGCAVTTLGTDTTTPATITIKEGAVISAEHTNAVYLPAGSLTVEGGEITGTTGIYFKSTNMTISGGTITGNGTKQDYKYYGNGGISTGEAVTIDSCNYPGGVDSVVISGGTFTSANADAVGSYNSEGGTKQTNFITGGTFSSNPSAYVADGYVAMKNDNGTWTVIAPTAIENGVTIKGIAGYERYAFSTISEAYAEISPKVAALGGLGEGICSAENFNAFYTDNGKITWTIYGKQTLVGKGAKDSQNNDIVVDNNSLTFGRAASYYGDRSLTKIEVKAGNESAALDLSATNGTFALPYNWWGQTVKNIEISFAGIIFDGIKSIPGTWATPEQETPYTFDHCTFNGSVYGYHDYNINLTIQNSTFNAPENTGYAVMLQSTTGINGTVTLDHNTFNGYTRGVNLQRPGTDFIFTNNTITSTVSEPDRAAIQLTDGKSFVVNGNTVRVNAGNAFWFHNAATNNNVTYTISNNDIEAAYIGYSGVTSFNVNDKITFSGNIFNSTDTTRCMKKEATEATATNLTAIH